MVEYSILHLSDIQFGAANRFGDGKLSGQGKALSNSIIEDIRKMVAGGDLGYLREAGNRNRQGADARSLHPVDLILVTGDISESGRSREYGEARIFLDQLSNELKVPHENIFLLPGNHDIDFTDSSSYESMFYAYRNFLLSNFYSKPDRDLYPPERPYMLFVYPQTAPAALFVCLNSSREIKDRKQREIHFPAHILEEICKEIDADTEMSKIPVRIMCLHHNFLRGSDADDENLTNADELFPILQQYRFRFVFHGHRHFTDMRTISMPDARYPLTILSAGSAGLDSSRLPEHTNQYQIVHFSPFAVTAYPRRYDPRTFSKQSGVWQPDPSYLNQKWPIHIPLDDAVRWFHVKRQDENKQREIQQAELFGNNPHFVNLLAHSGASYLFERATPGRIMHENDFFPGIPVRILLQDPDSPTAEIRSRAQGRTTQQVFEKFPFRRLVEIYNKHPNVEIRFTDSVYCSLFFTDKGMFYDPYHLGMWRAGWPENQFVVGYVKPRITHYHEMLSNHFEFLWNDVSTRSMENVYENLVNWYPKLEKLKRRPLIGNYRVVSLHDSWISVDPVAGCNGGCKYCYLRVYPLGDGKANESNTSQFFVADEDPNSIIEHVSHSPYLGLEPQIFCVGNFTDMFIKENMVRLRSLLKAWNDKISNVDSCFRDIRIGLITKRKISQDFLTFLQQLINLRDRVFFVLSYSGLDSHLEPNINQEDFFSNIDAIKSTNTGWKIVHFWRPLVKSNTNSEHLKSVFSKLTGKVDATVCIPLRTNMKFIDDFKTGSNNGDIAWDGLDPVWSDDPSSMRERDDELLFKVSRLARETSPQLPLYFNTSCAVSLVMGVREYNGNFFRKTYCDNSNCPESKRMECSNIFSNYTPRDGDVIRDAAECGVYLNRNDFDIDGAGSRVLIYKKISQDAHRFLTRKLMFPVAAEISGTTEWIGNIVSSDPKGL